MTLERCLGQNKDGSPCSARTQAGTRFCPWHDPKREADRAEWRRKGGLGSSNKARARKALSGGFKDTATAQVVLLQVLARLYRGDFDPGVATAMASVARAIDALAKTNATAAMEAEIAGLARQIAELSGKRSA